MNISEVDWHIGILWRCQEIFLRENIYPLTSERVDASVRSASYDIRMELGFIKSMKYAGEISRSCENVKSLLKTFQEHTPASGQRKMRDLILTAAVDFFTALDETSYTMMQGEYIGKIYNEIFANIESAIYPDKDDAEKLNSAFKRQLDRLWKKYEKVLAIPHKW